DQAPDLAPALSAALLRALDAHAPLLVSPLTDAEAWTTLAPVRDTLSTDPASGEEIARLVLLPVASSETPLGLFVLAQPAGALDPSAWIPLATAIAAAAAAGIRALQQTDATAAEARARDAFISLTGHELRSPLTSIKGYSQLLIRQARKNPLPDSMVRSVQA